MIKNPELLFAGCGNDVQQRQASDLPVFIPIRATIASIVDSNVSMEHTMTEKSISILSTLSAAAIATAAVFSSVIPANAISRIETTKHECSAIRASLIREGAAILRYTSKRGLPLYDRYVSSSLMCESPSVGKWARVPARYTNSCRVIRCDPHGADDDGGLLNFRPLLQIKSP